MSQSKQGNWRERDIQMRSAYYKAGHGKEGLLVEERAQAKIGITRVGDLGEATL